MIHSNNNWLFIEIRVYWVLLDRDCFEVLRKLCIIEDNDMWRHDSKCAWRILVSTPELWKQSVKHEVEGSEA